MATIEIEVGPRKYLVSCRDGEEAPLRAAAALVDRRAQDASAALGTLSETRLLLFTALMLADRVQELDGASPAAAAPVDDQLVAALEKMAARVEALAEQAEMGGIGGHRLEERAPNA